MKKIGILITVFFVFLTNISISIAQNENRVAPDIQMVIHDSVDENSFYLLVDGMLCIQTMQTTSTDLSCDWSKNTRIQEIMEYFKKNNQEVCGVTPGIQMSLYDSAEDKSFYLTIDGMPCLEIMEGLSIYRSCDWSKNIRIPGVLKYFEKNKKRKIRNDIC